jgi:hypothetical protein
MFIMQLSTLNVPELFYNKVKNGKDMLQDVSNLLNSKY